MRARMLLVLILAVPSCHAGTRMENFAAARGPRGAVVQIDRRLPAELLAATDSALLVARLGDGHIALVHFWRATYIRFEKLPVTQYDYMSGRMIDSAYVARLRLVARYAGGVTPDQLGQLLAERSQARPDTLP